MRQLPTDLFGSAGKSASVGHISREDEGSICVPGPTMKYQHWGTHMLWSGQRGKSHSFALNNCEHMVSLDTDANMPEVSTCPSNQTSDRRYTNSLLITKPSPICSVLLHLRRKILATVTLTMCTISLPCHKNRERRIPFDTRACKSMPGPVTSLA